MVTEGKFILKYRDDVTENLKICCDFWVFTQNEIKSEKWFL